MPVMVATCYFFNYVLVPRYLLTLKYVRFFLYSFYMLIVSLYLAELVIFIAFIFLAAYKMDNMAMIATDVVLLTMVKYLIVFSFSFVLMFNRLVKHQHQIKALRAEESKHQIKTILVRSDRKNLNLALNKIQLLESLNDYVKIHLEGEEPVVTKATISSLEKQLPNTFIRIHRSFIINGEKVSSFNRESVCMGEQSYGFGRAYRKAALAVLEQNTIQRTNPEKA